MLLLLLLLLLQGDICCCPAAEVYLNACNVLEAFFACALNCILLMQPYFRGITDSAATV